MKTQTTARNVQTDGWIKQSEEVALGRPKNVNLHREHRTGCSMDGSNVTRCYCVTDYCNTSTNISCHPALLLLLLFVMLLMKRLQPIV